MSDSRSWMSYDLPETIGLKRGDYDAGQREMGEAVDILTLIGIVNGLL